jgi:hypothetical protein
VTTGISSDHAPALDLPARFMALGMLGLVTVAALSPWAFPLLLDGFYAPRLLAFVHLNTLGVIAAIILGASYQLVPVVLQTELASVRLGRVSFWLYLSGLLLFLPGLLTTWRPALGLGASLVFAGLVVYVVVVAWTLKRAPRRDVVAWHIAAALVALGGGVVLGLLLALNKGTGFLGSLTLRLMAGHATLMLGGWVAVMLSGVAYRLVGMFTLSEDRLWHRVAWFALGLSSTGPWVFATGLVTSAGREVLLAGAILMAAGQVLFGVQLVHLYRVRRRRGFDIHIPFALVAAGSGVLCTLLLAGGVAAEVAPGSSLWVAAGWLAIAGLTVTAIQGFFYKIATFLVWLHRYAPLAGRQRVPRLEEMYGRRLARAGWALWTTALALSSLAIFLDDRLLSRLAGVAALAGLGCFFANVARIGAHWRSTDLHAVRSMLRQRLPGTHQERNAT